MSLKILIKFKNNSDINLSITLLYLIFFEISKYSNLFYYSPVYMK